MPMEEGEPQPLTPLPDPSPPPLVLPFPPPIAPIPIPGTSSSAARSDSSPDRDGSVPAPRSAENYEVSEESRLARERHDRAVQELLAKRRSYAMAVPTNDAAVRTRLRRLGEPAILFGEREMERRDRLRSIMLRLDADGQLDRLLRAHDDEQAAAAAAAEEAEEASGTQSYPFYTEGMQELLEARREMAIYSMQRAAARLERARRRREDPDEDEDAEAEFVLNQARGFVLDCSEIGDDRPLSGCSFSRDGSLLATRY